MKTFERILADEQSTVELGLQLATACSQQTTIYLHGDLAPVKPLLVEALFVLSDIKVM